MRDKPSGFRFAYDKREYELDFEREFPRVTRYVGQTPPTNDSPNGEPIYIRDYSSKPYTTVRILEVDGSVDRRKWLSFRTATAGCWHRDNNNLEQGRIHALRLVSATIPRGMLEPMWKCYTTRRRGQSVQDRILHLKAQLLLLEGRSVETPKPVDTVSEVD